MNLYRNYYNSLEESSSIEVLTVECEVVSAHLVNIRLTEREKDDQWVEEMTYSGTFTVWWDSPTATNADT